MVNEFEDILALVGSYGRYQKLIVIFILVPTSFFISLSINTLIFQTVVPDHYWCDPSGRNSTVFTKEEWWNLTVPRSKSGKFEKCSQYQIETENGNYISTNKGILIECSTRWEHDHISFQETMATSMMWFCDKEIYSTHIFSANLAGNAVGTLLLPLAADKITGRRLMFFIATGIHLVFNFMALLTSMYGIFLVLRFCGGLSFQSNYQMPYVVGLELTSPDKRAVVSFFSFASWTLGMCFAALVTWLVPHWWYLIVITCGVSLLFFCYWGFLPESPRWLLAKGKISECADIVLQIAATNNRKDVTRSMIEKELKLLAGEMKKNNFIEILKYKRILINAILVTGLSFTTFLAYGCTLVNIKILPNNYFLGFFVLSISELPSNIASYLSVHNLGRRFTGIVTSVLSMVCCFIATFFVNERVVLLIIVSVIKMFVTQGIYVVYIVCSEVFPTPVRSTGMGIVVVAGMASLVFSPYIVAKSQGGAFQYWIMMILCLGSFVISFFLPETIGLPLPQTFFEANSIGRNRHFFKWIHKWNKHKYQMDSTHEKEPAMMKPAEAERKEQHRKVTLNSF